MRLLDICPLIIPSVGLFDGLVFVGIFCGTLIKGRNLLLLTALVRMVALRWLRVWWG